jgi:hypothetical protein
MPEDHRPPREDIINVRISIQIVEPSPLGSVNEPRLSSNGSEGADRTVYPPGNQLLSLFEELDRSGDFHNGGAPYHAKSGGSRNVRLEPMALPPIASGGGKKCINGYVEFADLIHSGKL